MRGLHQLWTTRCIIIHQTTLEEIAIEELLDLKEEIKDIQRMNDYYSMLQQYNLQYIANIDS